MSRLPVWSGTGTRPFFSETFRRKTGWVRDKSVSWSKHTKSTYYASAAPVRDGNLPYVKATCLK